MPITSNVVSIFVGGTQKSGTRSLSDFMRQHPFISVHSKKEGHFFDQNNNFTYEKPIDAKLKEYHESFPTDLNTRLLCDITPDYIFRDKAIKRIYNYNPNAIWIILLRNPIERAYSAWNMEVNRKAENLTFEKALFGEINNEMESRKHDRFRYIGRSLYYPQIQNLWKFFPKNNCYFYPAESIWGNPRVFLDKILKAIKIPCQNEYNYNHIHKGNYKNNMSKQARALLLHELEFELTKLPSILGWQENPWIN